jgi:hypothetical protein
MNLLDSKRNFKQICNQKLNFLIAETNKSVLKLSSKPFIHVINFYQNSEVEIFLNLQPSTIEPHNGCFFVCKFSFVAYADYKSIIYYIVLLFQSDNKLIQFVKYLCGCSEIPTKDISRFFASEK